MEEPDSCQSMLSSDPDTCKDTISPIADTLMIGGQCEMISSTVDRLDEQLVISSTSSALNGGSEDLNLMDPTGQSVITIQQEVELNQYIPVEVFDTANVIEIDTATEVADSTSIPEYLKLLHNKEEVPDMVATETVVTTSCHPRRRKQNLTSEHILTESPVVEAGIEETETTDPPSWTLHVDGLYLDQHPSSSSSVAMDTQGVVEVLTSEPDDVGGYVAVAPDTTSVNVPIPIATIELPPVLPPDAMNIELVGVPKHLTELTKNTFQASIRALTKRQRDRLKKRELRMNPEFRLVEKGKARDRMRLRRQDPIYREMEREKDRIRRWQSRRRNDTSRQKERERDKNYKREHRHGPKVNPGAAPQVEVYDIDISDIGTVDL